MLIAAVYGGIIAGSLVAAATVFYVWWALVPPAFSWSWPDPAMFANFAMFCLAASLIIWVAARLRKTQQDLQIAVGELAHRGKNTFAVVEAIVRQSLEGQKGLADTIAGRIRAVSSTNDIVSSSPTMTVDLREFLLSKLQDTKAITLNGPEVKLSSATARGLSLAIHELRTNALKYGALSTPAGKVVAAWQVAGGMVELLWQESGGPPVSILRKSGFGTRLMNHVMRDIKGTIEFEPKLEGMTARVRFPGVPK